MERNSRLIGWLVLIVGLLCSIRGEAVDVNSAQALKDALRNATVEGNVVTLTGNVNLSNTLNITGGTMILDLNGKTITYDRTGTSETATAINVNGSEVDIVIKNGTIEVLAAKGKDGSYSWGNEKNGGTGKDAVCIQRNKGTVSLCIMKLIAKPGKGGAGYHGWGVNGNDGSPGRAYTIDPNTGTVNAMIAQGSYIVGASDNDYKSDGYPGISTTSYTTTVSLINYNVTYNANGGMPQPANATYTIESSNLSLPKVSKEGYDFVGWKYGSKTYDSDKIEKEDLPTTTERASQVNMAFEAVWKALNYKIIYNTCWRN